MPLIRRRRFLASKTDRAAFQRVSLWQRAPGGIRSHRSIGNITTDTWVYLLQRLDPLTPPRGAPKARLNVREGSFSACHRTPKLCEFSRSNGDLRGHRSACIVISTHVVAPSNTSKFELRPPSPSTGGPKLRLPFQKCVFWASTVPSTTIHHQRARAGQGPPVSVSEVMLRGSFFGFLSNGTPLIPFLLFFPPINRRYLDNSIGFFFFFFFVISLFSFSFPCSGSNIPSTFFFLFFARVIPARRPWCRFPIPSSVQVFII